MRALSDAMKDVTMIATQYFDAALNIAADVLIIFSVVRYYRSFGATISCLFLIYSVYNLTYLFGMLGLPVFKEIFQALLATRMSFDENMQPTFLAIIVSMLSGIAKACLASAVLLLSLKWSKSISTGA